MHAYIWLSVLSFCMLTVDVTGLLCVPNHWQEMFFYFWAHACRDILSGGYQKCIYIFKHIKGFLKKNFNQDVKQPLEWSCEIAG